MRLKYFTTTTKEWLRCRNYIKAGGQDKIKANNQDGTAEKTRIHCQKLEVKSSDASKVGEPAKTEPQNQRTKVWEP